MFSHEYENQIRKANKYKMESCLTFDDHNLKIIGDENDFLNDEIKYLMVLVDVLHMVMNDDYHRLIFDVYLVMMNVMNIDVFHYF
jgi:hypothetical protein